MPGALIGARDTAPKKRDQIPPLRSVQAGGHKTDHKLHSLVLRRKLTLKDRDWSGRGHFAS